MESSGVLSCVRTLYVIPRLHYLQETTDTFYTGLHKQDTQESIPAILTYAKITKYITVLLYFFLISGPIFEIANIGPHISIFY